MAFVYILSDYCENGAENVTATLDRSRLPAMVEESWGDCDEKWISGAKEGLRKHLQESDEELAKDQDGSLRFAGRDCHPGWGGMQLHVVELVD